MLPFVSLAAQQHADTLPIDTDRPDFTDATTTVAPHRIQLETGYTYQQGRGTDPASSSSWPEALLRIGLTNRWELRVGQNYLALNPGGHAATTSGFDDLYVGTKLRLADESGVRPAVSMEASTTLPTGSDGISAGKALPGAALLFGWSTTGPWSAGIEVSGTRQQEKYTQAAVSLSVQYQVTARVQCYGEWFTFQPLGADFDVPGQHYADTGVLILLSNNVQIDARGGLGLNHGADRFFAGVGFAVRR